MDNKINRDIKTDRKKKAGMLTFHFANNFGAALQTYALQYTLGTLPDLDVEIIDYRHWFIRFTDFARFFPIDKNPKGILSGLKTFPGRVRRIRKFQEFYENYYKLSERCGTSRKLKKLPPYDYYICGSDQIWNDTVTLGFSPVYFLQFAPEEAAKISYAPSFGSDISDEKKLDRIAEFLKGFQAISVREKAKMNETLAQKLGREPEILVDPTFLPEREHWEKLAGDEPIIKQKYILVYMMQNNEKLYQYARQAKELLGFPVVAISRYGYKANGIIDKVIVDAGPVEFLNLIRHAEFVCTNSFHGLAFSIIFEKKFFEFPSDRFSSRSSNLLHLFHMDAPKTVTAENVRTRFYDREEVERIMQRERERALEYLRRNISTANGSDKYFSHEGTKSRQCDL
ncbi:MAG: polysaccharide pyruvyl transferase family protein [Clostridiales bacterium]|nr:polysaccharide pyruvyl transferase family protein [Clostridiales bacterium]